MDGFWHGRGWSTQQPSVEERQDSDEVEGSEALAKSFGPTEARSPQTAASEQSGQSGVVGVEEQGLDSSTPAEPANKPGSELHWPEPKVSDYSTPRYPVINHDAEELEDLGGGTEAEGIEDRVEGSFVKEKSLETQEFDAEGGLSNVKIERESTGEEAFEEAFEEDNEEWEF
ncbi:hypothetical protein V496_00004 [Pseudogymnoascus sp. VKM F-4515 (FW-2607)]|nr:hypothetical protein V496_00004 [Pseudogymnoascus sp. VKM F-4515 (FW-2607)]KFY92509.1 hypothetical protein V498_04900 [Pseudogymnoascus sp. VKM F-4517 (FW-2822)]